MLRRLRRLWIPLLAAALGSPALALADEFPPPIPGSTPAPLERLLQRIAPAPAAAPAPIVPIPATPKLSDTPITAIREVRETLTLARPVDLTTAPDDLWERMRNGFSMTDLDSPLVLDRQIWYATKPQQLKRMVERSKRYLYHIVEELEKRGMPMEIALLPMVESAFNPMAYSRAHASGLWQFIPGTGKRYDLAQNWWYDGRRDIIAATNAALDYLKDLYEMHGDWHLALASYNWGENAVARAIERNKAKGLPTDYLSLTMPTETRYYVPKLQALKNIILKPDAFAFDLNPIPNQPYFVTVEKTENIDIKTAARLAEMPVEELIALNPAHNRPVMNTAQTQRIVLPIDHAEIFKRNLQANDKPLSSWQAYTLKHGDRLERLAAERGIALANLKQANGIGAKTRVGPGFQLLLPMKGSAGASDPLPTMFVPPAMPVRATDSRSGSTRTEIRKLTHTVARGDTLVSIADRYGVSVDDLRRWNRIGRLMAGQNLVIERTVQVPVTTSQARPSVRKTGAGSTKKKARTVTKKPKPRQTTG